MRVQQRTGTLKAFVRVSKNSDGLVGKDNAKPAMRMTRSRAAALAKTQTEPETQVVDVVHTVPVTPARKRKLTAESKAEDSPAKRAARAVRTPQRRVAAKEPVKRAVKATTINTYFLPKKAQVPKAVEPVTVESLPKPQEPVFAQELVPAQELVLAQELVHVEYISSKAVPLDQDEQVSRSERATTMLQRLRNRKRPAPTAAETAKIEETRAIQDEIRLRREQPTELPTTHKPSTFSTTRVRTLDEDKLRDLKRQFVKITNTVVPMPREFRKLEDLFQALEHTVMFDGAGSAGVVYHRIRKGVESMAQYTFGWKELGQILAVYPESYTFKDHATSVNGRRVQSVVLTPVARGMALAVEMEARRNEFKQRLVARVSNAHQQFLGARGYSNSDVEGIGAWHPEFNVEETPMVSPIQLPLTSLSAMSASGSVASFDREKLKHLLGTKLTPTVDAVTQPSSDQLPAETKVAILALPTPTDSPVLSSSTTLAKPKERPTSTASALLERIRAKQRAREQAEKYKCAVPASTRTMHSRLPGILNALSFLYYAERKRVLPLVYVADKLCESESLDRTEATQHVVVLAGFVPEWCVVDDTDPENPTPDARLKLTRAVSMQEAKSQLQAKIDAVEKPTLETQG
ncbi:hypothetical protein LPJ77_002863 [Coemansia sp. RSA 2523]|nr:hypothetical protein LPJ77_002863 [Coemansia sp. RSA 2523]